MLARGCIEGPSRIDSGLGLVPLLVSQNRLSRTNHESLYIGSLKHLLRPSFDDVAGILAKVRSTPKNQEEKINMS